MTVLRLTFADRACWLGGWAFAEVWSGIIDSAGIAATAVALLYAFLVVPRAVAGAEWNYGITIGARLVEGVASAHELHPDKNDLLDGVDTVLFWNAFLDHPFKCWHRDVYLAPGSEQHNRGQSERGRRYRIRTAARRGHQSTGTR